MSEYQHHELAALDHAPDARDQRKSRAISTRAVTTPTTFVNTEERGDLKTDPRIVLERYLDAFPYVPPRGARPDQAKPPHQVSGRRADRAESRSSAHPVRTGQRRTAEHRPRPTVSLSRNFAPRAGVYNPEKSSDTAAVRVAR